MVERHWIQKVSHLPQDTKPLQCSCYHSVYVSDPVNFLVSGEPRDIDGQGLCEGNAIHCQGYAVRSSHVRASLCLA